MLILIKIDFFIKKIIIIKTNNILYKIFNNRNLKTYFLIYFFSSLILIK